MWHRMQGNHTGWVGSLGDCRYGPPSTRKLHCSEEGARMAPGRTRASEMTTGACRAETPSGALLELFAASEPSRWAVALLVNVPSSGYGSWCAPGAQTVFHRASISNNTGNPSYKIQPVANSQRPAPNSLNAELFSFRIMRVADFSSLRTDAGR